jgi:phosphopantetheinyl transferase
MAWVRPTDHFASCIGGGKILYARNRGARRHCHRPLDHAGAGFGRDRRMAAARRVRAGAGRSLPLGRRSRPLYCRPCAAAGDAEPHGRYRRRRFALQDAKSGKPALDPAQALPDLHFSLSHTRGLAACAVGRPHALGIDAEAWRAPAPIELAARYFAPAEARLVAAPAERPSTFYRLWTLKEAYLKATGHGLAAPLDSFALSLDPVAIAVATPDSAAPWHFAEFRPGPAHSLALAVQSPRPIPVDAAAVSLRDCLGHPDTEL